MGFFSKLCDVQAPAFIEWVLLWGLKGLSLIVRLMAIVWDPDFTLLYDGLGDIFHSPLKPVHLMRRLVLIDEMFGKLRFGGGLMWKLDECDVGKLELAMLTEMGCDGVAGVLLVMLDVLLMVWDDHVGFGSLYWFIIVFYKLYS